MTTILSDPAKKTMYIDLERMRRGGTESVLWAVIRGRASPVRIALILGMPASIVMKAMKSLEGEGVLRKDSMREQWYLDPEHGEFNYYQQLRKLSVELEVEAVKELPAAKLELGYLSRAGLKAIKEDGEIANRAETPRYLLSPEQWLNLLLIRETFTEEGFTTSDYQQARGKPVLSYSRNELRALATKGMVNPMTTTRKGERWVISELGGTYEHEPLSSQDRSSILDGVDKSTIPSKVKGSPEHDTLSLLEHSAGGMTTQVLAAARGISRSAMHRQLARMLEAGKVKREVMPDASNKWSIA